MAREYGDAFNHYALGRIKEMLDEQVVFSQQDVEGSLIGKEAVLNKLKHQFEARKGGIEEIAETAIVDLSDVKAHPCLVVTKGESAIALILLDIKINNLIRSITVLTNPDAVAKARITSGR